jgi:hypothetical protein
VTAEGSISAQFEQTVLVTRDRTKPPSSKTTGTSVSKVIRLTARLAIDAGEYERARALLDVLEEKPRSAAVVPLASRRPAP